jgi:translation initiation factor 2 beta subunit (eIF-2beta)/eIF-5
MTKTYVAKKMEYEMVKTINGLFYKCKKCGDLVSKEHRELHELSRHTY